MTQRQRIAGVKRTDFSCFKLSGRHSLIWRSGAGWSAGRCIYAVALLEVAHVDQDRVSSDGKYLLFSRHLRCRMNPAFVTNKAQGDRSTRKGFIQRVRQRGTSEKSKELLNKASDKTSTGRGSITCLPRHLGTFSFTLPKETSRNPVAGVGCRMIRHGQIISSH